MDFLKDLFAGQAMTYDQLAEAVKAKGHQVVDAAGGAFVSKADADNIQGRLNTTAKQLGEANTKLEGFDPEWKVKAEAAQKQLDAQAYDFALDKALTGAKAKNATAVKALLDREKMSFAGGEVIGLEKQLEALRKGEDTAFLFQEQSRVKTGMSHQGGDDGTPDKKEEANDALRALFGSTN